MSRVGSWVVWKRVGKKDGKGDRKRGLWRLGWRKGRRGGREMDKMGRKKGEMERVRMHFWRFSTFVYGGAGLNQEPFLFFPYQPIFIHLL